MFDTLLTSIVKNFGDFALETLADVLYSSAFVNAFLQLVFTISFVRLGMAIYRKEPLEGRLGIFLVWLLITPVDKKPLFYTVINVATTSMAKVAQTATMKILKEGDTRGVLPPGFVFNAVFKAGTAKLEDESISKDVAFLIDNCIPSAKNNAGEPISVLDLFGGSVASSVNGTDSYNLSFDSSLLANRKLKLSNGDSTNCYNLLLSTRNAIRNNFRRMELTKMPETLYEGINAGEGAGERVTTFEPTTANSMANNFEKIAVNLAEAQYYQKEVLKNYFHAPDSSYLSSFSESNAAQSPLTSLTVHAFQDASESQRSLLGFSYDPTRFVADISNLPATLARFMGIDGSLKAGSAIAESNEEITNLPLKIAFVQLVLKFVAPIIILMLVFPIGRHLAAAWALGWFLTVILPCIILFIRSINNQIFIWLLRLDQIVNDMSDHPAFLASGVSFEAANRLVEDVGLYMAISLEIEKGAILSLLAIVPLLGGVLSHPKARDFLKNVGTAAGSQAARTLAQKGVSKGVQVVGQKMATTVLPALTSGGATTILAATQGFKSISSKLRGPQG